MEELRWILLGAAIIIVVAVYFWGKARKREAHYSNYVNSDNVQSFSATDRIEEESVDGWHDGVGPVRVVESFDESEIDSFNVDGLDPVADLPEDAVTEPVTEIEDEQIDQIDVDHYEPDYDETPGINEIPGNDESTPDEEPAVEEPVPDEPVPVKNKPSVNTGDVVSLYLVAPRGRDLKGEKILSATYATHLEYGEMDIFHRLDANGQIMFSMANMMEPGTFDVDQMNDLSTRGLSLFTQLSLCDDPVKAMDEMLLCAHTMAGLLDAQICDQNRQLLNEVFTKALREKAKRFVETKQTELF